MGFNLTEITNKQVPAQEQSAFGYNLVGLINNMAQSSFSISTSNLSITNQNAWSVTNAATMRFKFQGRRVGVILGVGSGYGTLSFNIDGTSYGTYSADNSDTLYNIPHTIATDLSGGEHILTITKTDTKTNYIQGFLVDTASSAPILSKNTVDYFNMLRLSSSTVAIGTTDTSLNPNSTIMLNTVITNTTASPINVTLKANDGTAVIGPFPVPANDFRTIPGPIYFSNGMKAIASATGCIIAMGVQN